MLRNLAEDKHVREVGERLEPLFSFSEAIYNLWAQQGWERTTHPMPEECIQLASLMNTQALRLFRSIVEQVRRCENYSATILSRTLFETLIAVAFLVKKDIRIIVEPIRPKPGSSPAATAKYIAKIRSKSVKRTRKHLLSYELRMLLFQAYDYFWLQKAGFNSVAKHPGMSGRVRQFKRTLDPALLHGYEQAIGPEWTYILKNSDNYAGLSIADRAKMAGKSFSRWYEALYPSQSRAVHGIDIHHHLRGFPSDSQVASTLWPAINLMLIHIKQLQDCIGLGPMSILHSTRSYASGIGLLTMYWPGFPPDFEIGGEIDGTRWCSSTARGGGAIGCTSSLFPPGPSSCGYLHRWLQLRGKT